MGKRSAFGHDAESRPQVKRTKISNDVSLGSNTDEDVRSLDQLRRLLAFQQENSTQIRRSKFLSFTVAFKLTSISDRYSSIQEIS